MRTISFYDLHDQTNFEEQVDFDNRRERLEYIQECKDRWHTDCVKVVDCESGEAGYI